MRHARLLMYEQKDGFFGAGSVREGKIILSRWWLTKPRVFSPTSFSRFSFDFLLFFRVVGTVALDLVNFFFIKFTIGVAILSV